MQLASEQTTVSLPFGRLTFLLFGEAEKLAKFSEGVFVVAVVAVVAVVVVTVAIG